MAQHNYEGLNPTDTPSAVPTTIPASNDHSFNPKCAHNPLATQCNQSQYPNFNHNFALPQLMAQHNYEDMEHTDAPTTVPTVFQASSDHAFSPKCAHNPLETQFNQSQYPNLNHNFALPQMMAKHNCEDLEPTDDPSTVPTSFQASSGHTSNILSVLMT